MKKQTPFLCAALFAGFASLAGGPYPAAPYTDCKASISNSLLQLEPLGTNGIFTAVLVNFSVEKLGGTPVSYILSGRVASITTHRPAEGVAVSIRVPGQAPRLAAISDDGGTFRFTVRIEPAVTNVVQSTEVTDFRLRLAAIGDGELCLGGAFDTNRQMVSGTVSRYNLRDLTTAAKQPPRRRVPPNEP
jgi:hypothetical protein